MSRLVEIREQLQDTQAALAQLDRALAGEPLESAARSLLVTAVSLKKRRRELEQEFVGEANKRGIDVCTYRLFAEHSQPTVAAVAGTIGQFQKLISIVYATIKHGPLERLRLREDVILETAFEFGYSFAGSVGLVFTLPNERLLGDIESRLDETFDAVIKMTEADSPEALRAFAHKYGVAPLRALYAWTNEHVTGGIGAGIDWQRNQQVRLTRLAQLGELENLREMLASTGDEGREVKKYSGILLGADAQPKRFHFKPDQGNEIRGTYENAINPAQHPELFKRYIAEIERIEVIHYATEQEDVNYFLQSLTDTGIRPYDHG